LTNRKIALDVYSVYIPKYIVGSSIDIANPEVSTYGISLDVIE